MPERYAILTAYKEFLSRSLSQTGAKRRRWIQVGSLIAVSLIYTASFVALYSHLYDVAPEPVRQFTFDAYPALEKIEAQMAGRGDYDLFAKYFVFSQMNLLALVLTFVAALFAFRGRRDSQSDFGLGGYFAFTLGFVSLVLLVIFATNDAGYGEGGRFLVYPKLGLGEFFFIRDSFFIGSSA